MSRLHAASRTAKIGRRDSLRPRRWLYYDGGANEFANAPPALEIVAANLAAAKLSNMTDNSPAPAESKDRLGDFLWGFWYPALRSEQVFGRKLVPAMLLDVPLVLGRDIAGEPFALRDVCPHRAFPLSFGQFDGTAVECAYHGWQFDAHTGQCRAIPSLTDDSKLKCERIHAGSFPVRRARRLHLGVHGEPRRPCTAARAAARVPNCPPSARATKSRISRPTCPAAWTTESSV